MNFGMGALYKNLSNVRELRGHRLSDGRILPRGVNKFLPLISILLELFW
jgi:hypothetical protein